MDFIIDLGSDMQKYRECASYDAILGRARDRIDSFLLENVILRRKMDSEQYLRFRNLYKSLQDIFGRNGWESGKGLSCIESVFDGRHDTGCGEISRRISALYKE